jgi:hypothetical protein
VCGVGGYDAHKVFDVMAEREKFLNFSKIFGGVDLNNVGSIMVVVVVRFEVVCKKNQGAYDLQIQIWSPLCWMIYLNLERICRRFLEQSCSLLC